MRVMPCRWVGVKRCLRRGAGSASKAVHQTRVRHGVHDCNRRAGGGGQGHHRARAGRAFRLCPSRYRAALPRDGAAHAVGARCRRGGAEPATRGSAGGRSAHAGCQPGGKPCGRHPRGAAGAAGFPAGVCAARGRCGAGRARYRNGDLPGRGCEAVRHRVGRRTRPATAQGNGRERPRRDARGR